jgi:ATPase subunit of ABC transporter with duplicated ATPase domains
MIATQNVTMRYGGRTLFEGVTVAFSPGHRYGLTGPNGAGKSTFLKILTGEVESQTGHIQRPARVGVLRQDQFAFDAERVLDVVIMGHAPLWAAMQERDAIYRKGEISDADGMRLGELEGVVADENGYEAESDAAVLLEGLGLPEALHARRMGELQGGQKMRVLLAQALFGRPPALLLDEPTNHLDLDSIHWLAEFLNHYEGTVLVISHDRHFLNAVCTHIADIDYQTIIQYTGGYDDMVLQKTQVRSRIESENAQREKKIAQLNDFIARFAAGTRSSQVASRKKEVERLAPTELARSNIQRPFIRFEQRRPSGKVALELEKLRAGHGDLTVLSGFSATVARGDKVAIVGRNGAGKTTLLEALVSGTPAAHAEAAGPWREGTVRWGHETHLGYFAQDYRPQIPKGIKSFDWLRELDPLAGNEDIRGILGQMLFRGDDAFKVTDALSGGESARVMFSKLMLEKPNVLLFDEPTNHLDLEAVIALGQALEKYEGTLFLVTHDEDLLATAANRVWHVDGGLITDYRGTWEEYVAWRTSAAAGARSNGGAKASGRKG